jgi:hypothetical protein
MFTIDVQKIFPNGTSQSRLHSGVARGTCISIGFGKVYVESTFEGDQMSGIVAGCDTQILKLNIRERDLAEENRATIKSITSNKFPLHASK